MKSKGTIIEGVFQRFLSESKPKEAQAGWQDCESVEDLGYLSDQQVEGDGQSALSESSKLLLELAEPHLEALRELAEADAKPKGELEPFQYTLN